MYFMSMYCTIKSWSFCDSLIYDICHLKNTNICNHVLEIKDLLYFWLVGAIFCEKGF